MMEHSYNSVPGTAPWGLTKVPGCDAGICQLYGAVALPS